MSNVQSPMQSMRSWGRDVQATCLIGRVSHALDTLVGSVGVSLLVSSPTARSRRLMSRFSNGSTRHEWKSTVADHEPDTPILPAQSSAAPGARSHVRVLLDTNVVLDLLLGRQLWL